MIKRLIVIASFLVMGAFGATFSHAQSRTTLSDQINSCVYENGQQKVTATCLNAVLNSMVNGSAILGDTNGFNGVNTFNPVLPGTCGADNSGQPGCVTAVNVNDFCTVAGETNGTVDATACNQAAIDYAFNNKIANVYCPSGDILLTSSPTFQDEPGNLRSNLNNPTQFNFQMTYWSFGGVNHEVNGTPCIIHSAGHFVAWWIGPGQGMILRGIYLQQWAGDSGPAAYDCGLNQSTYGVSIAGGNGGASRTLLDEIQVQGYYTAIIGGLNNGSLADSNTLNRVVVDNACYSFVVGASQVYINNIYNSNLNGTFGAYSANFPDINVFGGNFSLGSGPRNDFTLSSISSPTTISTSYGQDYTFTAVIASTGGDQYLGYPSTGNPYIYNAWALWTHNNGVIPLTMTNWQVGVGATAPGGTGTWRTTPAFANAWGTTNALSVSNLGTDIQASTNISATELATPFYGEVRAYGTHIENPSVPTTLFNVTSSGGYPSFGENLDLNWVPSLGGNCNGSYNPPYSSEDCVQHAWPFINIQGSTGLTLKNVVAAQSSTGIGGEDYLNVDNSGGHGPLIMQNSGASLGSLINLRSTFNEWGSINNGNIQGGIFGNGTFLDDNYFQSAAGTFADYYRSASAPGFTPTIGFLPTFNQTPCLNASDLATVQGSLPSIGATSVPYPILWGGKTYGICQPNFNGNTYPATASNSSPSLFESYHDFYSYGQTLPSNSWSGYGGSTELYLTDCRLFFPGLGFTLTTDTLTEYLVIGVHPQIGDGTRPCSITVSRATSKNGGDAPTGLHGTNGTHYTGTTIGQAAYNFGITPTLTGGACSGTSVVPGKTNAVRGTFTAALCSASTYVLSALPTAPTGWKCSLTDLSVSTDTWAQTATSTTSATMTGTSAAGNNMLYDCSQY